MNKPKPEVKKEEAKKEEAKKEVPMADVGTEKEQVNGQKPAEKTQDPPEKMQS